MMYYEQHYKNLKDTIYFPTSFTLLALTLSPSSTPVKNKLTRSASFSSSYFFLPLLLLLFYPVLPTLVCRFFDPDKKTGEREGERGREGVCELRWIEKRLGVLLFIPSHQRTNASLPESKVQFLSFTFRNCYQHIWLQLPPAVTNILGIVGSGILALTFFLES